MSEHHTADRREDLCLIGEHGMYDPNSGQLPADSLIDCVMPRAGRIRSMNVDDPPLPTKRSVLGAKGAGEAGCGWSLPARSNGVMNALRVLGIHHLDMLLAPNKVGHAIQNANKQRQ